ncbi:hypothetical protein EGW08_015704, partial [Elysia chlorotica]
MAAGEGALIIVLSGNEVIQNFESDDVISDQARVFTGADIASIETCLCGDGNAREDDKGGSGWCYLGDSLNSQRLAVNVSRADSSRQARLRCTLYVRVGKSYLYCNSRLVNRELAEGVTDGLTRVQTNCEALRNCPSRTITAVCSNQRDCVAWCDPSRNHSLYDQEKEQTEVDRVQSPAEVTHHLGHDVIGVIATGGALCVLVLACCVVDRIRHSKWWILRHPKKRKMAAVSGQAELAPKVSSFSALPPLPSYHQKSEVTVATSSNVAQPAKPQGLVDEVQTSKKRKEQKRKLKVQFRSMSLPTMLEMNDADPVPDNHGQHRRSCRDSPYSGQEGDSEGGIQMDVGEEEEDAMGDIQMKVE